MQRKLVILEQPEKLQEMMDRPPLFQGGPMAMATTMIMESESSRPQLWLWHRTGREVEPGQHTSEWLVGQGWQMAQDMQEALAIESQLYPCLRLVGPESQGYRLWFHPTPRLSPAVPVLLSFSTPEEPVARHVSRPLLNCLPPPHYGEYAFIALSDDRYQVCHITDLPFAAQQRWMRLGDAISALSRPLSEWPEYNQFHDLIASHADYGQAFLKAATTAKIDWSLAHDHRRGVLELSLNRAESEVQQLREALQKADWPLGWQGIHLLSLLLAHDYAQYHQRHFPRSVATPAGSPHLVASATSRKLPTPVATGVPSYQGIYAEESFFKLSTTPLDELTTVRPFIPSLDPLKPPTDRLKVPTGPLPSGPATGPLKIRTGPLEALAAPKKGTTGPLASGSAPKPASQRRRVRGKHVPLTPLVAQGRTTAIIRSDPFARQITHALLSPEDFHLLPDPQIIEYRHIFSRKEKGELSIILKPGPGEDLQGLLSLLLNGLGNSCIDAYLAAQSMAIQKYGTDPARICNPFLFHPNDILAICGRKKSHGCYTRLQQAEIILALKLISRMQAITMMTARPVKGKQAAIHKAAGPIIDLSISARDNFFGEGASDEEPGTRHHMMMGPWMRMACELGQQTALLPLKLLAYTSHKQVYQKRLGLYLIDMFRINARRGGTFRVSMQVLLERAVIALPKHHPERFFEAIMQALKDLKKDGVIGDFQLLVDPSPAGQQKAEYIQQRGRGWMDLYLTQRWNFSPPEAVLQQYRNLQKAAPAESGTFHQ